MNFYIINLTVKVHSHEIHKKAVCRRLVVNIFPKLEKTKNNFFKPILLDKLKRMQICIFKKYTFIKNKYSINEIKGNWVLGESIVNV